MKPGLETTSHDFIVIWQFTLRVSAYLLSQRPVSYCIAVLKPLHSNDLLCKSFSRLGLEAFGDTFLSCSVDYAGIDLRQGGRIWSLHCSVGWALHGETIKPSSTWWNNQAQPNWFEKVPTGDPGKRNSDWSICQGQADKKSCDLRSRHDDTYWTEWNKRPLGQPDAFHDQLIGQGPAKVHRHKQRSFTACCNLWQAWTLQTVLQTVLAHSSVGETYM